MPSSEILNSHPILLWLTFLTTALQLIAVFCSSSMTNSTLSSSPTSKLFPPGVINAEQSSSILLSLPLPSSQDDLVHPCRSIWLFHSCFWWKRIFKIINAGEIFCCIEGTNLLKNDRELLGNKKPAGKSRVRAVQWTSFIYSV